MQKTFARTGRPIITGLPACPLWRDREILVQNGANLHLNNRKIADDRGEGREPWFPAFCVGRYGKVSPLHFRDFSLSSFRHQPQPRKTSRYRAFLQHLFPPIFASQKHLMRGNPFFRIRKSQTFSINSARRERKEKRGRSRRLSSRPDRAAMDESTPFRRERRTS